jgi:hypothetical protein
VELIMDNVNEINNIIPLIKYTIHKFFGSSDNFNVELMLVGVEEYDSGSTV